MYSDLEAGFMAHHQGNNDLAMEIYTRILREEKLPAGDLAIVFFLRGEAALDNDLHDQAIHDFTQALKLKEDYTQAYYYRALAHEKLGETREAYDDLRKAAELEPEKERYRRKLLALVAETEAQGLDRAVESGGDEAGQTVSAQEKPTGPLQ